MYRSKRAEAIYRKHLSRKNTAPNECDFCKIDKTNEQFMRETSSFKVIKNIFPYEIWDHQIVLDHLMIVPKKHMDTLAHISNKAAGEYIGLVTAYEKRGYCIFARAAGSVMKSIPHQHTHLIKLANHRIKGVVYHEKFKIRWLIK